MAEITAGMVKELREKTGAGMMDCKKALNENDGDVQAAIDWLRKKGIAKAEKKSSRAATDGLVAVVASGPKAAVVELNAETDFVARNDKFQGYLSELANHVLENGADDLENQAFKGKTVGETVTDLVSTIGENISLRRATTLSVSNGVVSSYIHGSVTDGMGKIGVLVALESEGDAAKLDALGKQIAMHIAAARPEALSVDDVDQDALERERSVLSEQARASGKPDNIIEKMVEGRIRKYYEEVVLLEQVFVVDGENKVGQVVENMAKELGTPVKMTGYLRYELGEGLEKKEENFAEEVAKAAAG